jgi:rifampin ADP-ribosylating transferase
VSHSIDVSALAETAAWSAEFATALAATTEPGHTDVVEPTGPFEDDPDVTDKRFPGSPTQSYRTHQPPRVVAERADRPARPPELLAQTLDTLTKLRTQGLDLIED